MAQSLSLASGPQVFACAQCRETINTSMEACPFCLLPVDKAAAVEAAAEMSRVSEACSDASYLRVMAGVYAVFWFVIFIPFLGLLGMVGIWFLQFAIPVMAARWWVKYGRIRTADPDFPRARWSAVGIGILGVLLLIGRIGWAVSR